MEKRPTQQGVIFYFSGTGNTWWCARELRQHLEAAGMTCRMVSIEQTDRAQTRQLVENADIIGLGYPIYGSDLPQPMKDFIDRHLPENLAGGTQKTAPNDPPETSTAAGDGLETVPKGGLKAVPRGSREGGKRLFVFCTQLLFSGDGAFIYRRELAAKGWRINWGAHFLMPNNVCVTVLPIPYTTDQAKIDRRLQKTGAAANRFARAVAAGRPYKTGASPLSRYLGLMQRAPFRKLFHRLRDDISIHHERCTRCGRCVTLCPADNLFEQAGRFSSRGVCVLCLRCYNYCPAQAVLYKGKPHKTRRGVPYRGPLPDFKPESIISAERNRK